MNIALVTEFFPPFVTGGAELFLESLAGYLSSRGHKIVVITSKQNGKGSGGRAYKGFRRYEIESSPIHVSHRYQFHGLTFPWMFYNHGLVKQLKGIYEKEKIDIVYINNLFHLSFAPLQAADVPVVLEIHDYWNICFSKDLYYRKGPCKSQNILKCSYCLARKYGFAPLMPFLVPGLWIEKRLRERYLGDRKIKRIICHSEGGVEELRKRGYKSTEIPYPYLGHVRKHTDMKDGVFRLLFVGRLEEVKGADLLLRIARSLKGRMDYRIDVIGRGPLQDRLDRRNLHIYTHGFLGKERFDYFRKADCLLAIRRDPVPFGIIVIEAMAHQLPVIALEGTGPEELVKRNDAGIVSREGNLVEDIIKLQENREFAENIRKRGHKNIKKYSRDEIFKNYEKLFAGVYRSRKRVKS